MDKVSIKYLGGLGTVYERPPYISIREGQTERVPEQIAASLITDFPRAFRVVDTKQEIRQPEIVVGEVQLPEKKPTDTGIVPVEKTESTFYILGTGPSINDITPGQWKFLEGKNTIGIGFFCKHEFVPKYHYVHERDPRHAQALWDKYNGCVDHPEFLIGSNIYDVLPWESVGARCVRFTLDHLNSFKGRPWSVDKDDPPYGFDDVWATSWDQELFGFRGTLMVAINAATIMGATEVVLCGVDLEDNHHFYSKSVDHSGFDSWIHEDTPEWDPETGVHSTCVPARGCRGIIDGIRWVSNNVNLKCASKRSLLVKESVLDYKSLQDSDMPIRSEPWASSDTPIGILGGGPSLFCLKKDSIEKLNSSRIYRTNYYWLERMDVLKEETDGFFFGDGPDIVKMYSEYLKQGLKAKNLFTCCQNVEGKIDIWKILSNENDKYMAHFVKPYTHGFRRENGWGIIPTSGMTMFCTACIQRPPKVYVAGIDFYTKSGPMGPCAFTEPNSLTAYDRSGPHRLEAELSFLIEGCKLLGENRVEALDSPLFQEMVDFVFANMSMSEERLIKKLVAIRGKHLKEEVRKYDGKLTAVVFLADRSYSAGLNKTIYSLNKNSDFENWDVDKILLSSDHEHKELKTIKIENTVIECKMVPRLKMSFDKIKAFGLDEYDRVIFIDSDMLCLGDISGLLNCWDRPLYMASNDVIWHPYAKYDESHIHYNSGVMVINKPMLGAHVVKEMMELASHGFDRFGDQTAINEYIRRHNIDVGMIHHSLNFSKRFYYIGDWYTGPAATQKKTREFWDANKDSIRLFHVIGEKPWEKNEHGYDEIEKMYRTFGFKDGVNKVIEESVVLRGGRSRPEKSFHLMMPTLEYTDPGTVLDVGCGRGVFGCLARLQFGDKFKIDGLDIFKDYLGEYTEKHYGRVYIENAIKTIGDHLDYDMYWFLDVLEHMDDNDAVDVVRKVMEANKRVIVSIPVAQQHWNQNAGIIVDNPNEEHIHNWTVAEVIERMGLRLVGVDRAIGVFTNA